MGRSPTKYTSSSLASSPRMMTYLYQHCTLSLPQKLSSERIKEGYVTPCTVLWHMPTYLPHSLPLSTNSTSLPTASPKLPSPAHLPQYDPQPQQLLPAPQLFTNKDRKNALNWHQLLSVRHPSLQCDKEQKQRKLQVMKLSSQTQNLKSAHVPCSQAQTPRIWDVLPHCSPTTSPRKPLI